MDGAIPWMVVGALLALLVVLWHFVAYRDLKEKHDALLGSIQQLEFNREMIIQTEDTPLTAEAAQMLTLHYLFYEKQATAYNALRKKPFYALPAIVLGFRSESGNPRRGFRQKT